MIKIIDNFISHEDQELIKKTIFNKKFPWSYMPDITSAEDEYIVPTTPAMGHPFIYDAMVVSHHHQAIRPIIEAATAHINFDRVEQAKSLLQFPLNYNFLKDDTDEVHVDQIVKHYVVLYYVIDSDGDTVIINKKLDGQVETNCRVEDYETLHRVTPKQGRVVIFDGAYYHTATQPRNNMRCVININVI
jgi:hypothetical protein